MKREDASAGECGPCLLPCIAWMDDDDDDLRDGWMDRSVIRSKLAASTTTCNSINVDLVCDDRSGHGIMTMILVGSVPR